MVMPADLSVSMQLSGDEASNGLVLPAVAIVYFGKAGAVLVVIMCFMAVTSSGAGEILAAASLFTFDIYRKYIRPKVPPDVTHLGHCKHLALLSIVAANASAPAYVSLLPERESLGEALTCMTAQSRSALAVFQATGKELLAVSRSAVVIWGIIIGLACCMCTGGKLCWTPGLAFILG